MSTSSSQQPCPRCQFLLDPGVFICPECGLHLDESGAESNDLSMLSHFAPATAEAAPAPSEFFVTPDPEAANAPIDWNLPDQPPFSGIIPPPAPPPSAAPVKPRRSRRTVVLTLILVLVIVLGAGGSLAFVLTRPKPTIQVKSDYHDGATLVGSTSTSFHVTGQKFTPNASITFLLDGQPASGVPTVRSDGSGNVQADLTVQPNWAAGKHLLTASDDQGYLTKTGITVEIVAIGLAGTPGPDGAPADDASFDVTANGTAQTSEGDNYSLQQSFTVVGSPDPAGGRPCGVDDGGQDLSFSGTLNNSTETYTETIVLTCQGSYKQGHIVYTEIATSDTLVLGHGEHCASAQPYIYNAFDGTFGSTDQISGVYYRDYFQADCDDGTYIYRDSSMGSWSASI